MSYCRAVSDPMFEPAAKLILSVTQGNPTLVTTSFDNTTAGNHNYNTGLAIRFHIPDYLGMSQLNGEWYFITVVNATQFTVPVDSTDFDPFVQPVSPPDFIDTCAWVIPIGENSDYTNSVPLNVT